jgi:hypothetical protein
VNVDWVGLLCIGLPFGIFSVLMGYFAYRVYAVVHGGED